MGEPDGFASIHTAQTMRDDQWTQSTQVKPDHPRKANAFEVMREHLPGREPTRVWSNFRFLTLEGAFFEVDALVLTPAGVFLVECVTRRGHLDIGADIWLHTKQNEQVEAVSSPYKLAQKKADELQSLLSYVQHDDANFNIPSIEPLVFVSQPDVSVDIDTDARRGVLFHPDHTRTGDETPSLIAALDRREGPGLEPLSGQLDHGTRRRFESVFDGIDIKEIPDHHRLEDYRLLELLETTDVYQDYLAEHASTGVVRRARVFRIEKEATDAELARIQEAARRTYDLLAPLDHDGILPVVDHLGLEQRPTVFFEHPPEAVRLDHFMARRRRISPATRFAILEQVAEAVRYAHEHMVVHRAINPRSILVVPGERGEHPGVRLFNWHTGRESERATSHERGTQHVSDYLHDTSKTFLAPEVKYASATDDASELFKLDVFGLGTLAYYLFTGQPPGPDLQTLVQRLTQQGGLRPAADRGDIGPTLDELVFDATRARTDDRLPSASDFLDRLAGVREEVVSLDDELNDPLEATAGDRLGPYTIDKPLGTGSTAKAFRAEDEEGREVVLKIAKRDADEPRLEAEAEALREIDAELVVDLHDVTVLGGRRTLVMQSAGETLLEKLRDESALSLYDQMRYGEDLCRILVALEEANVFHRDIKPSNLGVARPQPGDSSLHLLLFDFSLKGVDVDNTEVGTRAYRDPFLGPGDEGRRHWDLHADRYSAAVVLHEMVTQRLPTWGDGLTNPIIDPEAELHVETERLPAPVRDGLDRFFRRALARDVDERFDTAHAMLEAWRDVYTRIVSTEHGTSDEIGLDRVRPTDDLARLADVSEAMRDALDGLGISTVAELIEISTQEIYFMGGVDADLRRDLVGLHEQLTEQFPGLETEDRDDAPDGGPRNYENSPVEEVWDKLETPPADFDAKGVFSDLLSTALAADAPDRALPWRAFDELAERTPLPADDFVAHLEELFDKWRRKRVLPPLRDDIERLVDEAGGIIEASALAREVLGERGSRLEGDDRLAMAAAVTRAAVETELAADNPRYGRRPLGTSPSGDPATFVATRRELFDLLPDLGDAADRLAGRDRLASSERAARELADVFERRDLQPPARRRLLDLAAAASTEAAVSSQDEIYPRDLEPVRALNLCANLLMRRAPLKPEDVDRIVRERYPQAQSLPERPQLDRTLDEADVALEWNASLDEGIGAYESRYDRSTAQLAVTRSTAATSATSMLEADGVARSKNPFRPVLDDLEVAHDDGGFLALTVRPRLAREARDFLVESFELTPVSVDRIAADLIRERADAAGVDWSLLLEADAPDAPDTARRNLRHFLEGESILERLHDRIVAAGDRILLTEAGLLGHWHDMIGSMHLFEHLTDRTDENTPDLLWLLVPMGSAQPDPLPRLDGEAVPVDEGDYLRLPSALLEHRGGPSEEMRRVDTKT